MKILVVDDEKLLVKGIKFNLENEGYEVDVCYDGETAVDMARSLSYDLILLDLMMPRMNGVDMLDHVKSSDDFRHIPVFILSNLNDPNIVEVCYKKGAIDYLLKSQYVPDVIFEKVQEYLVKNTKPALK